MRRAAALLSLLAAVGCGESGRSPLAPPTAPTNVPAPTVTSAVTSHLESIVRIMETNSIKRQTIDWTSFRSTVFAAASSAQTIPEAYPAIQTALRLLGDGHSSYTGPNGQVLFVSNRTCTAPAVSAPTLPATIGYVRVTGFSGSGATAIAFADGIQDTIVAADRDDLAGWIVDLRGNGGGNMWPMLAGVGPVLGEGVLGFFVDPQGFESVWEYRNGVSFSGGFSVANVSTPYRLKRPQPKVAVLTDNRVASSGEATLIAFIKRPNTRTFGAASCGLSTANRGFPLTDGANLNLTVSTMADRAKTRYGDQVAPDEAIADPEQAVSRAVAWLQSQ